MRDDMQIDNRNVGQENKRRWVRLEWWASASLLAVTS